LHHQPDKVDALQGSRFSTRVRAGDNSSRTVFGRTDDKKNDFPVPALSGACERSAARFLRVYSINPKAMATLGDVRQVYIHTRRDLKRKFS
jgi:hypothetical protein